MKSNCVKLIICYLLIITALSVNAQEETRDQALVKKIISDIKNPQFVWGIQDTSNTLSIGLTDFNYYELRDGSSIWYVQKKPPIENVLAHIFWDKEIVYFVYKAPIEAMTDTLGYFNTATGKVTDLRNDLIYHIDQSGYISNQSESILKVGEEVNRNLVVFFLLDQYSRELKRKEFMQEKASSGNND